MSRYKIILSYDGSLFGGWQMQPNCRSIQGCLQDAFGRLFDEPIQIIASGRTDAGVHAKGQVAHFTSKRELFDGFLKKINLELPPEIRVLSLEKVALDFHARFSAIQKTYHYHIATSPTLSPFKCRYCTHLACEIDLALLQKALKFFVGTHNFTSFANRGSTPSSPIKTVHTLHFVPTGEGSFRLEFTGDGFLYKMVRNIVGTLVCVARGAIPLGEIQNIFAAEDRRRAPSPAPPQGLFLISVDYVHRI